MLPKGEVVELANINSVSGLKRTWWMDRDSSKSNKTSSIV
jgi:hypothetical protein